MRQRILYPALLAAVWLCTAREAHADSARSVPRLGGPITLDGVVDEPVWAAIEPLPTVVYEPTYGMNPSQRTEIRIGYDSDNLYVAAQLYDSRPDDVRDNSLYRDQYAGDDTLGLIIDAFNDDDTALWFYTTPAGMRVDGTVSADMASGEADWSWNGHWDAAAQRTSYGWSAEMRIPFATLGFQSDDGRVVMGISVYRWLARHNERHIWPDVPPTWRRAYAKPSRIADVELSGVRDRRALYVAPYGLLGYAWAPEEAGTMAGDSGGATYEAGLDLKYAVSSSLTVDVTLNTDFAQVEADDEQVNLTRFPLFFPEKRQFFLERASVFDFALSGSGRLFHSRRIGLIDGRPVRILGGARLVARTGRWDIGVLDMQTAATDLTPYENFGVVRVRRQVLDAQSNAGAMLTTRIGTDGSYNLAYGLDSNINVIADEHLMLKWAQSIASDTDIQDEQTELGSRFLAGWQRRRQAGLSYSVSLDWASAAFDPGVGFEPRQDFRSLAETVEYRWLLGASSPVSSVRLGTSGDVFQRNSDQQIDSASLTPYLTLEARQGHELELTSSHRYEDVLEPFSIAENVTVPAGSYDFHRAGLAFGISSSQRLRASLAVEGGGFYGGRSVALSLSPTWNISRHLNLGGDYELDLIRLPGAEPLDVHVARLRVQLALDIHASLSTFLQYSSLTGRLSVNGRVRYHVREGTDFWLVYNERAAITEDRTGDIDDVLGRTVLIKYTHTFAR